MGKKEAEGQGINKIKTSNKTSQYPIIFPHCLYYSVFISKRIEEQGYYRLIL